MNIISLGVTKPDREWTAIY